MFTIFTQNENLPLLSEPLFRGDFLMRPATLHMIDGAFALGGLIGR